MTPDQLREWTEPESADLAEWVAYSRDMRCALAAALEVNANHRETLRSIAKMDPATEGARMRQWASDALSGYTQPASVTMAQLMEEVERLKVELGELKVAFCNLVQKASVSNEMHKNAERRAERLIAFVQWFDLYGVSINTVADERGVYRLDWHRGEAFGNTLDELITAVDCAITAYRADKGGAP